MPLQDLVEDDAVHEAAEADPEQEPGGEDARGAHGRRRRRPRAPRNAARQRSTPAGAGTPSRSREGSSAPAQAASRDSAAETPMAATKPSVNATGEA